MQLRKKTLLIIGITLFCLIAILYTTSQFILLGSFKQLEEQDTQKNIERARDALLDDTKRLDSIAGDYAAWDDTYIYVQDGNRAFVEANVIPSALANLRINYMLFYNISGTLLFGMGIDNENHDVIDIPEFFEHDSFANNILLKHKDLNSSMKGIINLPEGPVLIASRPVITSAREGPIMGTLIIGSFLDSTEIERLSSITHLSLSYRRFDDPGTSDFLLAIKTLSPEKPIFIQPISNEIIAGNILLNDIEGKPAIVLKAEIPRGIHMQGQNTMNYLVVSIIGSGFIFGIVILWLLENNVLSRLAILSSKMSEISTSSNLTVPLAIEGEDELSNLSGVFNKMMTELKKHRDHLEEMVEVRTLQLNKSLQEKEVLLREIHHRVKNNMQVVSSLLLLQTQNIQDQKYINIFNDSNNRILSIALIHEKLYQSKDFESIDVKEYIHELASNLLNSYGRTGNVKLEINVENVILDINKSVPCGLIINELLMNSLKYAFPDGRQGTIKITFKQKDNNMLQLTISDDGVGIPKDLDIRNTKTLGLNMVTQLVENQLDGEIILLRDRGTEFQINVRGTK
ncbi:MAG: ATP-binding protein [Candidatus Methanoperedens sp.]|nr:ATP-binding protein [Candidatus Methanoperedens sp.]